MSDAAVDISPEAVEKSASDIECCCETEAAQLRALRLSLTARDSVLREAILTIEGLAEQQAMPDTFYHRTLSRIRYVLGEGETK